MNDSAAIVIGAGSSIGSALCRRWQQDNAAEHVFAVSRQLVTGSVQSEATNISCIDSDYTEATIDKSCDTIKMLMYENQLNNISLVYRGDCWV